MSKGVFRSHSKVGETMSIQLLPDPITPFDPTVSKINGRVSWDLDVGSGYTAGNSISYMFPSASARTVTLRTNLLSTLTSINLFEDNVVGNVNLSGWSNLFKGGGQTLNLSGNALLTGITHTYTPYTNLFYWAYSCDITGDHDLTMFPTLGSDIRLNGNSNLTSITHTASTAVITYYSASQCDLTGNLNMSMFSNLGGLFSVQANSNLTSITHTTSPQTITNYSMNSCDITGTHYLPFSEMGGQFYGHTNSNLTNIVHSATSEAFTVYKVHDCDLTGVFDLSMLTGLGGQFECYNNSNLTDISHGVSSEVFTRYWADACNMGTILDVSMLSGLGGSFNVSSNSNLKNVVFPYSTQTFGNVIPANDAFAMDGCNFAGNHVDFKPLSGSTMDVNSTLGASIRLYNNSLTATDVNHLLEDFADIAGWNTTGWSGVTLNISGTNSAPDTTSGGFNGIAAINTLTGSPYNWIITTS